MENEIPVRLESNVLLNLSTKMAMARGCVHEAMAARKRVFDYL
jgi:hypothetical protein